MVAGATAYVVFEELSARRQEDRLLTQRGQTVLAGIVSRLEDRQRAKQIFAQLLADQPGLAGLIDRRDKVGLAQILVPLKVKLGVGQIEVYGANASPLIALGPDIEELDPPLVRSALSGVSGSVAAIADEGLVVLASAPVKGPRGIVGALVVGKVLEGAALKELKERGTVEIAVYEADRLVGTTVARSDLAAFLEVFALTPQNAGSLEQALAPFGFRASILPIQGGTLMALVPVGDLTAAAHERQVVAGIGTIGLLALLIVVIVIISRDVVRPIEAIVTAAGDIVRGNYQRRLPPSSIRELDGLTRAVNHLTQQLEIQIERLAHQALHDPLSNLPNRTLFMDRLGSALARAARQGRRVAMMFLDLDNFKVINDSLGHQVGDQLLVAVAARLGVTLRSEDTIARLGGDEFAILAEGVDSADDAALVAERIAKSLREPFPLEGHPVFVTTSVGIAISEPGVTPESLLRHADIAMYHAKNAGKARRVVFDATMTSLPVERLQLEADLRRALEHDEFKVYYQPIVDIRTGRIVQVEALARWEHPRLGFLGPAHFIPLAEETGLILPLGRRILEEATRAARTWPREGPGSPIVLSVNLSVREFQHEGLLHDIAQLLEDTPLPAAALQLEITESVLMKSGLASTDLPKKLKQLGVSLSIDDFGTGYSSLAYIKQFPICGLKIDRSFVRGLGTDEKDTAIVQAIISLAQGLKLRTTAEGVETARQRDLLQTMGCDLGQGYLFARPMPLDALEERLAHLVSRPETTKAAQASVA